MDAVKFTRDCRPERAVTVEDDCGNQRSPQRMTACRKRFAGFTGAFATVAVLGQRPCEFHGRRCKATDRHYVVETGKLCLMKPAKAG